MSNPKQSNKGIKALIPLIPPQLTKYVAKLYEKLHFLDIKYTETVYSTVQKYTLLRVTSKVIAKISDGPALPIFFLLYLYWKNPAPLAYMAYMLFWVFYHELGIKNLFQRHRPATAHGQKGFSFPSSHSFASGFIIVTCLFFNLPYESLLVSLSLINAANRPAYGVHYIADVIAGMALGSIAALGWPFILRIAMVVLP